VQPPRIPAQTSPGHSCRPEWNRTAFAPLSAEQFLLRSSSGQWPTKSRWSQANRGLLRLRARSAVDSPTTTGEEYFTYQLHLIHREKLHRSAGAKCRKGGEISLEKAQGRNAVKISDEAGATRLFAARCVTSADGSLPPHQFSECTNRLSSLPRRSAFLLALLRAGMVTCARRTRVTVAVTNAGTSDTRKTPRDTEVMNRTGRGENPGMCWSDPVFWPKTCGQKTTRVAPAHHAFRVNVLSPRPRVGTI
jgi:hypothetical protein